MKKKLISSLLVTSMVMASLIGCSGGKTEPTTQATTKVATESTSAMVEEFTYPVDSGVTLTYWTDLNTSVAANYADLGDTPFAKSWAEATGIQVDFLHPPTGQTAEAFSLLLADGDLPDLMEYNWSGNYPGGPQKAIKDGNILRLNEIFEQYCPNITKYLAENPDVDRMIKTDEGDYYAFPFIRGDEGLLNTIGLMLRGDWLEELGLEVPTTIEEWETVLIAFKEEKGATAPFTFEYNNGSLNNVNPFAYAFDTTRVFYLGEDGKVHYGPGEENYKNFLETFNRWYEMGLIDQDLASMQADQVNAKMTSGEAGASIGWAGSRMGTWINAAQKTDPNFNLVAAPFPTVEKGAQPQMGQIENKYPGSASVAITTSCENVELAARLLDYAYGEEGHMLFNFGVEGVSYEIINGYPTYTEDIINNPDGWSFAQSLAANIRGNYNGPFVQDIRYLEQYYQIDSQKEAIGIWGATEAVKYAVPPITPTEEESKEYSVIMSEINTYRDEMTLKFIFGTESLDNFDKYLDTINQFGLERALEIQNAALERFYAR